ncbi:MAG: 4-hydroxybenzoate octaprenyltransferase [Legionellaceae bacterium]|nr:4-hydroxybenzoate octaprenyltransferase [Legionellaceae bacterium]
MNSNLRAYIHLLRIHKPIGTLLLWFPTAWALWFANGGMPPVSLMIYFFFGTFIMRSAGCLLNDLADRHVDPHVARTKNRPLANHSVSVKSALILLAALLFIALVILLQLPIACFKYAVIGVILTAVYPFCKRFFDAPQLVLGLTFSMGIPMAYAASNTPLNTTTGLLVLINFFWIVAYDTIYAMADKPDDLNIGVRSTAILFGAHDKNMVLLFQSLAQVCWLVVALHLNLNHLFYIAWGVSSGILILQQVRMRSQAPNYLEIFTSNSTYGLLFWVAIMLQ